MVHMAYYKVGTFIKLMRKQRGLSQTELAEGLLDKGTLSRIENGHQAPTQYMLDALARRLGLDSQRCFNTLLTQREYEAFELREEIAALIRADDYESVSERAAELEENPEFSDALNRQFLLWARACVISADGKHIAEEQTLLLEAIHISIPSFDTGKISSYLLTDTEIKIINAMALNRHAANETEEAIRALYSLKESIDGSHLDRIGKAENYTTVLYNLSKCLGLAGRFEEAVSVCDTAISFSVKSSELAHLPKTLFNKAYCVFEMAGDSALCKRLILQSYWGCDFLGNDKDKEAIKKYALEKMGIDIDTE